MYVSQGHAKGAENHEAVQRESSSLCLAALSFLKQAPWPID